MNKMRFYLMLLLLFGFSFLPCVSLTKKRLAEIEEEVAKMSEAVMRAELLLLKAQQEELKPMLKKSFGNDKMKNVDIAFSKQVYEQNAARINAIEKRLRIIDSKREQEQKQQQGQQQQNPDEQRSAEFGQSVNENINRSQPRYREYNKTVDANNNAAREGSVALDLVSCNDTDPDFKPISENMLVQQHQCPTAKPNIRGKFNNKKSDESQTKEQQKQSQEDEYLKLMQEMQNDLNSLQ